MANATNNIIPFPIQLGEILGTAARNNGNLLAAAREVKVSWEGNRAILVGSEIPTFQTALKQTKVSNEKEPEKVDMTVLTLPSDFRIPRQQVEAAKENGTYNRIVAEHLADAIANSIKAVEYAFVHGYDLGSGGKLTVIDPLRGSFDWAVGDKASVATTPLKDLGKGIAALDDFNCSHIFMSPDYYQGCYTDGDGKGSIPFNTAFNYTGITTMKTDVLNAKGVAGAQDDKILLGDFTRAVWGAKPLSNGIEIVMDGNPRGKGELRDTNEVAFLFEIGYAWAVTHPQAFSIVKGAGAAG